MDHLHKRGKEDSVTSSNIVHLLLKNIKRAATANPFQLMELTEVKILKEKCCDANVCTAFAACEGFEYLVEKNMLFASQAVSALISLLPSIIHYSPLVVSIGNILLSSIKKMTFNSESQCPYNFTDKPHPFIILLRHHPGKFWSSTYTSILNYLFINDGMSVELKINLFRPFFMYVFCDPSPNSLFHKKKLFSLLLLRNKNYAAINKLVIDGLAWQQMEINYCWLIQELCQRLLESPDEESQIILGALTPYLAVVIKWLILNGHHPILWIDLLSECLQIDNSGAGAVVYILSGVLLDTPVQIANHLVKLCETIIYSFSCNKYIAQKFAAVSLIWMVNPSSLSHQFLHTLENIFKFLQAKLRSDEWFKPRQTLSDNPYFCVLKNSQSEVRVSVEMAELSNNWKNEDLLKWLKHLYVSNNSMMDRSLGNFISGVYLFENNDEVLDISSKILLSLDSELSFNHLCLTFFKLSQEVEPKRQLIYLGSLVKIATIKKNVPLVIRILETLKNDETETMSPVIIDLYLKLWKVDHRVYSYLHNTLFSNGDNSWEINVMKTVAIREICKSSPETYGKNLVSKLSEILNHCDNYPSGIPSAIAIEAVIELCKASVTDITGAWKALKPRLSRDKRREVIISLCKLFSEVPALKSSGAERDDLVNDIVPRLWGYAFSNDVQIVRAALMALSKFSAESYGPKLLPNVFKADLEIPKQYLKSKSGISREKLLDVLEYVPGECWIEVMQRIDLSEAGEMVSSLIQEELHSLPKRFFCHPEEVPEPVNYTHLPHSSICRALVSHVKKYLESEQFKKKIVPDSVPECLRILSCDYTKCLPVLDWSFLEKFFFIEDCRRYSVTILAKQATASRAGRKVLEAYVATNVDKFKDVNDFTYLYPALPYVCNSLSANTLRQFLDKTIKISCCYSLDAGTDHFENVLKNAKITLESKIVPDPRKALLVTQIQNVLALIPPEHAIMKAFGEFVAGLPFDTIYSITTPASGCKVTSDKIRRCIYIRKIVAFQPECTNPLVLFNECIEAVLNMPQEHNFLIGNILDVLRKRRHFNHRKWLIELIWKIQASISPRATSESVKITLFLLDIFSICVVTLSGYDYFLETAKINSLQFLPVALLQLLKLQYYSNLSPQVIEWIHGLSKWKKLPEEYVEAFQQSILILRDNKFCSKKSKWLDLFYMPAQ